MTDAVHEARTALIEACADYDDELMEMYLEEADIPHERIAKSLHRAALDLKVTPVLCGSAFKNKGVQPLLDAIVELLPSPLEVVPVGGVEPVKGDEEGNPATRPAEDDGPFAALAFKVMTDPFVGKLTYFRVYSGKLGAGGRVLNVATGRTERIGRLLMMHANSREEIEECYAGDILAGVGLKQTTTGDTLCAPDAPIALEQIVFPEPVIAVAIEPKTKADQEKLATALQRLSEEDPTFRVETDHETGQTVINGMGELHLEVLVDRMLREFKVDATVGKPQVAYRETIREEAEQDPGQVRPPDRWLGPVRRRRHQPLAEPRGGLRVRQQDQGRRDPDRVHPVGREGDRRGAHLGRQGGLSDGRRQGRADRRLLPRRRLLRDRLQDRRLDGHPGSREARQAGPARAGDGGRGRHARGLPRRRDRRPLPTSRQGRRARSRAATPSSSPRRCR